jgi:hypothetical protein
MMKILVEDRPFADIFMNVAEFKKEFQTSGDIRRSIDKSCKVKNVPVDNYKVLEWFVKQNNWGAFFMNLKDFKKPHIRFQLFLCTIYECISIRPLNSVRRLFNYSTETMSDRIGEARKDVMFVVDDMGRKRKEFLTDAIRNNIISSDAGDFCEFEEGLNDGVLQPDEKKGKTK